MKLTASLKPAQTDAKWYVVDATDIPLGRLATQIATRLRGKHKTNFTPHTDNGDHIIVINAEKIKLTGFKAENAKYHYHTGFVGGIKSIVMGDELKGKHPHRVVERAVKRMLPKESSLARRQFKKLHVYAGSDHPHTAQQPQPLNLKEGA